MESADFTARFNAGLASQQAGRHDEAEVIFRSILVEQPEHTAVRFFLGTCLLQQDGRADEGATLMEGLLDLDPVPNAVLINLGLYHYVNRRYNKAEEYFRKAVAAEPNNPDIHNKLASTYLAQKRYSESIHHRREALHRNPSLKTAYQPLVGALRQCGRFAEAYLWGERWLWAEPSDKMIYAEQGLALARARFYADAAALIRRAPEGESQSLFFEAYLLQYHQDFRGAISTYRQVLALDPDNANAHFNLSLILLGQGQLEEGWREFDYRFREGAPLGRHDHLEPEWDGRELNGAGILVHSEQGFGDVIQFMRFFPLIQARGGKILFASYPDIITLLKARTDAEIIQHRQIETLDLSYQWQIPLLSLGKIFAQHVEDIPANVPYVTAPKDKVDYWKARLADDHAFKVGLVWAGNPEHVNDHNRSSALTDFAPLAEVAGVSYYALQKGPTARQADCPPSDMWLTSLDADIKDFTDTAAILEALDLVICVDTSVAHLAGAQARPVWLMLPDIRDWRWIEGRDDSPWYPSMRLFRRGQNEEWRDLFERAAQALRAMLAQRTDLDPAVRHEIAATQLARAGDLTAAEQKYHAALAAGGMAGRIVRHAAYNLHGQVDALPTWLDRSETTAALRLLFAPKQDISALSALQQAHPDDIGYVLALLRRLREAGRVHEAEPIAEQTLAQHPERWDLRYELAQCQKLTDKRVQAEENYRQILVIAPRAPEAGINRAMTLDLLRRHDEALQQLQYTALCQPFHPLVRRFLATLLMQQRHYDLALLVITEHRRRFPDDSSSQFCHASILRQLARYEEAVQLLETLPDNFDEPFDAAQELVFSQLTLHPERAVQDIHALLTSAPAERRPQLEYSLGLQLHLNGESKAGWASCEGRRRVKGSDTFEQQFRTNLPAWEGEPLAERRLLIFCEQGFGDTLQFLRYLNYINGTCILIYQDGLDELLAATITRPNTILISRDTYRADPIAADCYANLLSLPHLLGMATPPNAPYLILPPGENPMAPPFADETRRKVGVVWAGNPKHLGDRWRSISLRSLLPPLLDLPNIAWYSLQKDQAGNEALFLPKDTPWLNAAVLSTTFLETAQVLDQLDLIISVDTAIAHLAGAMGKRVWLLLPAECDWRWGRQASSTAWYPSMRIFRQHKLGDWSAVIAEVRSALAEADGAA